MSQRCVLVIVATSTAATLVIIAAIRFAATTDRLNGLLVRAAEPVLPVAAVLAPYVLVAMLAALGIGMYVGAPATAAIGALALVRLARRARRHYKEGGRRRPMRLAVDAAGMALAAAMSVTMAAMIALFVAATLGSASLRSVYGGRAPDGPRHRLPFRRSPAALD